MSSIKVWISATRPKTLPFGLSPVIVGSMLGLHYGHFSWTTFFLCFSAALFMQIGANYANDVFDFEKGADNKDRIGPVRAVASGAMSCKRMKLGMALSFLFAFLFSLPIIFKEGWILLIPFIILVVVAIAYSGGPRPLSYIGLGEITNLIFMAGLPTMIMCFVQTHKIHASAFWLGICFGGLTSAVMCLNNLRDEKSDRAVGKKSLVVRFGPKLGQLFYAFLLIYPFIVPWLLIYTFGLPVTIGASSLLVIPCIPLLRAAFSCKQASDYSELFSKTALLALLYSLTLAYGLFI